MLSGPRSCSFAVEPVWPGQASAAERTGPIELKPLVTPVRRFHVAPDPSPAFVWAREELAVTGHQATAAEAAAAADVLRAIIAWLAPGQEVIIDPERISEEFDEFERFVADDQETVNTIKVCKTHSPRWLGWCSAHLRPQ
jgi:hypothetical protein